MIANAARIFLTGIYLLFAGFMVVIIAVGLGPYYLLAAAALHVCIAIALNNTGGKGMRMTALFSTGLQTVIAVGSFCYAAYTGLYGDRFELGMFSLSIILSVMGFSTIHLLRNMQSLVITD